jgi:hypothetical protein
MIFKKEVQPALFHCQAAIDRAEYRECAGCPVALLLAMITLQALAATGLS